MIVWPSTVVYSQVNGEVFDLDRVLEGDCSVEFLKFDDHEGTAYISQYGALLT